MTPCGPHADLMFPLMRTCIPAEHRTRVTTEFVCCWVTSDVVSGSFGTVFVSVKIEKFIKVAWSFSFPLYNAMLQNICDVLLVLSHQNMCINVFTRGFISHETGSYIMLRVTQWPVLLATKMQEKAAKFFHWHRDKIFFYKNDAKYSFMASRKYSQFTRCWRVLYIPQASGI